MNPPTVGSGFNATVVAGAEAAFNGVTSIVRIEGLVFHAWWAREREEGREDEING